MPEHEQQQAQHEPASAPVELGKERVLGTPATRVGPPGWVTTLPKGLNGSAILRDPRFGRAPGVYPVKVVGTFGIGDDDDLGENDNKINLCYIPHGVMLTSFTFICKGVTGTVQDSLPTPTQYATLSGAVVTMNQMTATQGQNLGTMYFETPRPRGKEGAAVVQWYRGMVLRISGAGGSPTWEDPMIYVLEWSPVFDGGV